MTNTRDLCEFSTLDACGVDQLSNQLKDCFSVI